MKHRCAALVLTALGAGLLASAEAQAAKLPPILSSPGNTVPTCATPGRLMAFLRDRSGSINPRFDDIATEYMRHGEDLNVRWDYAFFQMVVETGGLTFKGDVKPEQNNFAGLGATGGGVRGEVFRSVGDGARAHMQHTMLYAGEQIDSPVAERTAKIQEWKLLDKWRSSLRKPVTFEHLTRKWSPTDRGYARDIQSVADRFFATHCAIADPNPGLVAKARGTTTTFAAATPTPPLPETKLTQGEALAKAALDRAQENGDTARSSLGGPDTVVTPPSFTMLNGAGSTTQVAQASTTTSDAVANVTASITKPFETANAAGAAAAVSPKVKPGTCRVWTASYGGNKAIIIKAKADDGMTNFTVLDVHKGREKREAEAYIAAYAKGGEMVGEYRTKNKALNEAFVMCPEETK